MTVLFLAGCSGQANVVGNNEVIEETNTKVPVLMYHYIREVNYSQDPLGWNLSTAPKTFELHLEYLKNNGYQSIHLRDLAKGHVPEKSIIFTFDDGLEDFHATALPLLEKYGFSASNAIITGKVGHGGYMDLEQIKDAITRDTEILAHSVDHRNLATLDFKTLSWEISESAFFIAENFGVSPVGFVYPSGFYDERVFDLLSEYGYRFGLTVNHGLADVAVDNPFELPRIRVDNRDGLQGVIRKLENLGV